MAVLYGTSDDRVVPDPLIVVQVEVGAARCDDCAEAFIGVSFIGEQSGHDGTRGEVVLTLEMAEHFAGLLQRAIAKLKGEGEVQ